MGWGENNVRTPVTPEGLRRYDSESPTQAACLAWHIAGPNPAHHHRAVQAVRDAMPLLARALDRMVPTRTPYIARERVIARLMAAYDVAFPDATPFQRGSVEYEYGKTLDALNEMCMVVAERVE